MSNVVDFLKYRPNACLNRAAAQCWNDPVFEELAWDVIFANSGDLHTRCDWENVPTLTEEGKRVYGPLLERLGYSEWPTERQEFLAVRNLLERLAQRITVMNPKFMREC